MTRELGRLNHDGSGALSGAVVSRALGPAIRRYLCPSQDGLSRARCILFLDQVGGEIEISSLPSKIRWKRDRHARTCRCRLLRAGEARRQRMSHPPPVGSGVAREMGRPPPPRPPVQVQALGGWVPEDPPRCVAAQVARRPGLVLCAAGGQRSLCALFLRAGCISTRAGPSPRPHVCRR